jgi:hypothetical protein
MSFHYYTNVLCTIYSIADSSIIALPAKVLLFTCALSKPALSMGYTIHKVSYLESRGFAVSRSFHLVRRKFALKSTRVMVDAIDGLIASAIDDKRLGFSLASFSECSFVYKRHGPLCITVTPVLYDERMA